MHPHLSNVPPTDKNLLACVLDLYVISKKRVWMATAMLLAAAMMPTFTAMRTAYPQPILHASRALPCRAVVEPDKASGAEKPAADPPEETLEEAYNAGLEFGKDIKRKFAAPRIDDPGLPYADALVCICGSIFLASLGLTGVLPRQTWLQPLDIVPAWRGLPYIVPACSHGAGLAACWILGALAAEAFERGAYLGTWQEAFSRTWKGGAFAAGILLLSTQVSTFVALTERGLDPSTAGLGIDPAADLEVIRRGFEATCDIAVQCVGLTAFRIYRWRDAQP